MADSRFDRMKLGIGGCEVWRNTKSEVGVMLAVTIWYAVSAKNTFKGPVRTIDELDTEVALPEIAQSP